MLSVSLLKLLSAKTCSRLYTRSGIEGATLQAKQAVRELLERLPDDCTLDDVLYHLYVVGAVERGRADVTAGRTISHQQVAEELRKKWQLGDGG